MGRALVLSDDVSRRAKLAAALEVHGLQVDAVGDGIEAFQRAFRNPPAVIVAEPGVSDAEIGLERIRQSAIVPTVHVGSPPPGLVASGDAQVDVSCPIEEVARLAGSLAGMIVPAPRAPDVGDRIGDYVLEAELGRGGMGLVFRARHIHLERAAALKLLLPDSADQPKARARFMQEWRTVGSLNHPNIVAIYDAGEAAGWLYLAMELVRGSDFGQIIRRGHPLPSGQVLHVLDQAAAALGAAHEAGVIHRDFKPANLLVEDDVCRLTDFGIAHVVSGQTRSAASATFGTVGYVAPEQLRGEKPDERTDVYALGCTMYEALAGVVPWNEADSVYRLMYAHMTAPPPRVTEHRADLSGDVDAVIARAMAKERDARFASPTEAVDALGAALRGEGRVRRFQRKREADPAESTVAG